MVKRRLSINGIAVVILVIALLVAVDYYGFTQSVFSRKMLDTFSSSDLSFIRETSNFIVLDRTTDEERVVSLMNWTHYHMIFTQNETLHNPVTLIRERKGMCDEYSLVLIAMASSLGYDGRLVRLTGDGGHFVTEILINGTWVVFDPTFDRYYKENGELLGVNVLYANPRLSKTAEINVGCTDTPGVKCDFDLSQYYLRGYEVYNWYGKRYEQYDSFMINPVSYIVISPIGEFVGGLKHSYVCGRT